MIGARIAACSGKGTKGVPYVPPVGLPANTVLPALTGTAQVGQTLSCTTGTWTGTPTITFARQWARDGTDIPGATSATYVLVTADIGTVIICVVVATNGVGSANAVSNASATIASTAAFLPATPIATWDARTISGANNDTIETWTSPEGFVLSGVGSGAQLKIDATLPGGQGLFFNGTTADLVQTVDFADIPGECTIITLQRPETQGSLTYAAGLYSGDNSTSANRVSLGGSISNVPAIWVNKSTIITCDPVQCAYVLNSTAGYFDDSTIIRRKASGAVSYWANGVNIKLDAAATTAALGRKIRVGRLSQSYFKGNIFAVVYYNRALTGDETTGEIRDVLDWIYANYGIRKDCGQIIFIGDSATSGTGTSNLKFAYPQVIASDIRADGANFGLKFQNSGSGGTTAAHTNAIWVSTAGNPCGGWFVDHRVVSVWHGTNDITAWGTTTEYGDPGGTVANAAAVWAQYSALMTKYKGTFGKVIAWTSMDRGAYNVSNGDACMDEFNALVRANYLSCADYLVDVAQDLPQMRKLGVGQPGANTSGMPSAYFADTAHPNDAGYALIAALAEPVIRAAIGIGSGPPVTGLGGFDFSQAANSAWVAAI